MNNDEVHKYQTQQNSLRIQEHEKRLREVERAVHELTYFVQKLEESMHKLEDSMKSGNKTLHQGIEILAELSARLQTKQPPNTKLLTQILVWAGGAAAVMFTVISAGVQYIGNIFPR